MPPKVVRSTYCVLTIKSLSPLIDIGVPETTSILFKLPEWFINWKGTKIIKVYGCSFIYLETADAPQNNTNVPKVSTKYSNQFISVHSNIVRDDSTPLHIHYEYSNGVPMPFDGSVGDSPDYLMTVNNFYNAKVFDVSGQEGLEFIKLWFVDSMGKAVPLRVLYNNNYVNPGGGNWLGVYQAVIRMECELAILE
jgi:hypothetical protein